RWCFGRRGRRIELDLEDERPDLDEVAVREVALLHNADAIDEGTVAAAQVAQRDGLPRDPQHAVLAADPFAVGTDVAFRAAAKEILAMVEKELLSLGPSLDQA